MINKRKKRPANDTGDKATGDNASSKKSKKSKKNAEMVPVESHGTSVEPKDEEN